MSGRPSIWGYLTESDQSMDAEGIKRSFAEHIEYTQAKDRFSVTPLDFFQSLARTVRDRMSDRWNRTQQRYYREDAKRVYYLSLEFLLGRLLRDGLNNLGMLEPTREALAALRIDLDEVLESEWDAGLGNGGLGRLAACFLDSMATLGLPATGYGIRYEYGIFKQVIVDGAQVESPDNWLRYGNPWEIPRPEVLHPVKFYGHVEPRTTASGRVVYDWVDTQVVMAMAYDVLVPGFRNDVVNTLRLWAAKASREFDLCNFNRGDYVMAVHEKNATENISRVLYPADQVVQGRELRLKQEYFFVSATLQDAVQRHMKVHGTVRNLHEKAVFQLNDTHPALAVPELMRLLVDVHQLEWDEAWAITRRACAYTNHTVLPEALEVWPVPLFEKLLPRHLEIVYEINERFLRETSARHPGDVERLRRVSLIEEGPERRVRMANLAVVGSSSVNGVSALHTRLLRERIFREFAEDFPERFNNKTNGITPRRWLLGCNPGLAELLTARIGDDWLTDLRRLEALLPQAEDEGLRRSWRDVRRRNKERLARIVEQRCGVQVDPASMFDVQVKRLHEYKRQLLNALGLLARYRAIRRGETRGLAPRTVLFGGKAAPAYRMAKLIIELINAVGARVNADPATKDLLRVAYIPNYSVSLAEAIMPAADLSEQISTAGMEASGTGNMKFALNGALTIGTLDGANVEILEAVGRDGLFLFGLDEPGVVALRRRGYDPRQVYDSDPVLHDVLDAVASGELSPDDPDHFKPIVESLLGDDHFLVLADFADYRRCQADVDAAWHDGEQWTRRSIRTTARMGGFSSDLTIARYAADIWGVPFKGGPQPSGQAAVGGRR
jgi:starch phosphorylase